MIIFSPLIIQNAHTLRPFELTLILKSLLIALIRLDLSHPLASLKLLELHLLLAALLGARRRIRHLPLGLGCVNILNWSSWYICILCIAIIKRANIIIEVCHWYTEVWRKPEL